MNIYKPQHRSKAYLFIIAGIASLFGWALLKFYRPIVIEASCNEIAASSGSLYKNHPTDIDAVYFTPDNVKARCIEDVRFTK